jgi:sec-independent protein translocase protein TatA
MPPVLAGFGPTAVLLIAIALVLIFFRRLPEIARSLTKSFTEFKKGYKGLEDEDNLTGPAPKSEQPAQQPRPPEQVPVKTPRFADSPAPEQAPPKE